MTQANPLRVGLIGAGGRWGPRAHVPALQGVPETELYAMCTAHAETAQAAADKFGVECAYGSDAALNADKRVEAVAVAVRVPAHYQLTKNALEAGKHVFCEWPLGANTKEAEELAALARQKNLRTVVGLQRRKSPAYLYMRELIQQGYVGTGALGEHAADEQRRVDAPVRSHLAARCHVGREHIDDYLRRMCSTPCAWWSAS